MKCHLVGNDKYSRVEIVFNSRFEIIISHHYGLLLCSRSNNNANERYFKLEKCNPFFLFDEMETKINEVNANADAVQMQSEMKKRVEKFFLYEK